MGSTVFGAPFTLDRSRHAAVQVYEFLREEIAYFDLSVTPIRDALRGQFPYYWMPGSEAAC